MNPRRLPSYVRTIAVPAPPGRPRAISLVLAAWLVALVVVTLLGPWLAAHGVAEPVEAPFAGPHARPPFGTDHLGRDVWSRILHGGPPTIVVPLLATAAASVAGTALGFIAAAMERRGGDVIVRVLDSVIVLPPLLVLLVLLHRFAAGSWVVALGVVVVITPYVARFARATATAVLASGYVEQAIAMGESRLTVLTREVAPNLVGPVLADAGLRLVGAVYLTLTAGFLGFGPNPPATDWGSMIAENIGGARLNPWAVVAPCAAIGGMTVTVNLLADRIARRLAT